uniref:Uncharacterized protein n=1 Tax=Avena sativa TaxID=4498 RepID=A0ACD5Y2M0_AVESA
MARYASLAVCFLWLFAGAAVCGARELQPMREVEEPLALENHTYASFDRSHEANLSLLGYSSINGGALQLTPDTINVDAYLVNKSGSVLLTRPFKLWRTLSDDEIAARANGTGTGTGGAPVRVVSFNTTFSMNVFYKDGIPGEGLAFVIAPSLAGPPPGSDGGFLGLTNATLQEAGPAANLFVAVEFDTFKQSDDPSDNHVGLDVGSVVSNVTANLADFNITSIASTEENPANYTAWIEYDGVARHIAVYMVAQGKPKPASPVLAAPLDLSEHVPEQAYIGFAASTGANWELNCILDWTLSIETFPEEKENKWWIALVAVVVSVGVIAVAIAAFFLARMSRARRAEERSQARLGHTLSCLPGMPREFESLTKATNNFHERLGEGVWKILNP